MELAKRQEILTMLALVAVELKQTRFYQEIAQEEGERGRQEGHQEGHQEGRKQESLRLVSRMMRHKFGVNGEPTQAEQQLPRLSL